MRIIARSTLRACVASLMGDQDRQVVKATLDAWFHEVRRTHWKNMADVKRRYATASVITSDRAVFNIKGNSSRFAAAIDFEKSIVWIKWIGSHKTYDQIDVAKVQHEK